MTLVGRLRTPDAMAMRQAADEIEALHAMLMEPDWNVAQHEISIWRKARGIGVKHVEVNDVPIDEAFLDTPLDRKNARAVFGRGYGVRISHVRCCFNEKEGEYDHARTVRDLVRVEEIELMRTPNLGRRTVDIIKAVLAQHGLRLGMKV